MVNIESVAELYLTRLAYSIHTVEEIDARAQYLDEFNGVPIFKEGQQKGLRFAASFVGWDAYNILESIGYGPEARALLNFRRERHDRAA